MIAVFLIGYTRYNAGNRVLKLTTEIDDIIERNWDKTLHKNTPIEIKPNSDLNARK